MSEVLTGLRFIRKRLTDDATLMASVTGVYQDAGPVDAQFPFITIGYQQDGADELCLDGTFVLSGLPYIVKVVGLGGSFAPLETIAERMKALLHRTAGDAGNGEVYECVQTSPVAYREDGQDGKIYAHLGGLYELAVRG